MTISLIVALAENGLIGRAGDLPWRMRSDLARFKTLTLEHTVIAGRKTHESIVRRVGGPLPGRRTVVVTRQAGYRAEGCSVVHSWEEALSVVRGEDEVFVIGGAEIYALALPYVDRLHLTRVGATLDGDVHFPALNPLEWRLLAAEPHASGEQDEYPWTFELLERKAAPVSNPLPRPGSLSGGRG